jgi:hypothetical protein
MFNPRVWMTNFSHTKWSNCVDAKALQHQLPTINQLCSVLVFCAWSPAAAYPTSGLALCRHVPQHFFHHPKKYLSCDILLNSSSGKYLH